MDMKTKTRIEYEHQFFGFSSDSIIDAYRDFLRNAICEAGMASLAKLLKKKLIPAALDENALNQAIDEMTDSLRCDYIRGVDYAMTKVEGKIRECFHIPDYLYLPQDRIVATTEGVDEEALDDEISDLKQELKNIAYLIEEAKEEQAIADKTIAALEKAETALTKIHPLPDL